jgi:hypothetical protein
MIAFAVADRCSPTATKLVPAGVPDELELHVVPVLLGQGRRLLDNLAAQPVELERTPVLDGEGAVNHLHYGVHR